MTPPPRINELIRSSVRFLSATTKPAYVLLAVLAILLRTTQLSPPRLLPLLTKRAADPTALAERWLSHFARALTARSGSATAQSFLPDGWLRDVLVHTWDAHSTCGRAAIAGFIAAGRAQPILGGPPAAFALERSPHLAPRMCGPHDEILGALELAFRFETPRGLCRGLARLREDTDGEWRALSVYLMLDAFRGYEEVGPEVALGTTHAEPWERVVAQRKKDVEEDLDVLVVGAGQTGLQVAARMQQLGIKALTLERSARVGDVWRMRYRTLALHTPSSQHSLLYAPYPSTWPIFTPKEKFADWCESYATQLDLPTWTSASLLSDPRPTYDSITRRWTVHIQRGSGIVQLHPAHLVLATGLLGAPYMPAVPARSAFPGEVIHAREFHGGDAYAGRRVLVVGAANTAADICEDLYHSGAREVTMLQRSSTCVVSARWLKEHYDFLYEEGVPVEVGDFRAAASPLGLREREMKRAREEERWPEDHPEDKKMKEGLRSKGFVTNEGRDGLGTAFLVVERFGGHLVDVGCAQLIIDEKVTLKSGAEVSSFTPDGVVFSDGSSLACDVVIFATGYLDSREDQRALFGPELIDATTAVWGLDEEHELKGAYRPSGHPGFWYTAGDFATSRWGSKQLALLIQAQQLGYRD